MKDILRYVSFKRVMEVLNLLLHIINAVMNLVETCVNVVEMSVHFEVHSSEGFLQRLECTQNLW